jgi:hypothetical protein
LTLSAARIFQEPRDTQSLILTPGRKGAARPAATKEFEQETEFHPGSHFMLK